jgi:hypothetical protein
VSTSKNWCERYEQEVESGEAKVESEKCAGVRRRAAPTFHFSPFHFRLSTCLLARSAAMSKKLKLKVVRRKLKVKSMPACAGAQRRLFTFRLSTFAFPLAFLLGAKR